MGDSEEDEGREILGDDDPVMIEFFGGGDFSGPLVEDGGKGLTFLDAEPDRDAEVGLSNEEFWGAAELADVQGDVS